MRIISGDYGGRRLKAVPGKNTRPTTDKVKESLFNIIGPYFDGGNCLDLFAGSGGLSIEAVSRGMDHAVLFDKSPQAIQTIKENIEVTKEPDKFEIYRMDAERGLDMLIHQQKRFELVFLDPPYAKQKIELQIRQMLLKGLLTEDSLIVCETDKSAVLPERIENARLIRRENYGISQISIYQTVSEEEEKQNENSTLSGEL